MFYILAIVTIVTSTHGCKSGGGTAPTTTESREPESTTAQSRGTCNFSRDCESYRRCQNIQDASCVCKFGKCVISGGPPRHGTECTEYTDCECRSSPDTCYCRRGYCSATKWECHEPSDCNKLNKCSDKNCACSGNLCEFECSVDANCSNFHCNRALGYKCKCKDSLCAYEKKPKECSKISDCVNIGLCSEDSPCACTQSYCTVPWWVDSTDLSVNCRSNQDCDDTIYKCQGGKCHCTNIQSITEYEERGTCTTIWCILCILYCIQLYIQCTPSIFMFMYPITKIS